MSGKYASHTILQLKEELKKRGAKLSGKKNDLIERLESYDRNANFGEVLERDIFNMDIPENLEYKDINSDTTLPPVTVQHVQVYLQLFGQELRSKSIDLYKAKFLKTLRSANHSDYYFIQGRVSAEMTKKCIYKVDIKLDMQGVVVETQCECAAGMGPEAHCKHVAVTLFALTNIEKGIVTQNTCTDRLQTFHHAKSYTGSPVKMENVILREQENSRLRSLKDFDPRPLNMRNSVGYNSHFRNIWINSSTSNCPIRQLYQPANILGVCHDHDYLAKTGEDMFLENIGVLKIDKEQCNSIEKRTVGQSNIQWKEERRFRLHASSFGKIMKLQDTTDGSKLARSLTCHKDIMCAAVKHGKKYESSAILKYTSITEKTVQKSGICVNPEIPYLGCSPDGIIGTDGIVEVKCPYTAKDLEIGPVTVPYLYFDENKNLLLRSDHDYYYQVMGNLLCTNRSWCDFVVWTFKDIKVIHIERNEAIIDQMKKKLETFFILYFKDALLNEFLYKNSFIFNHQ